MKTITTLAVLLLALTAFEAEAAITCEPNDVLAGSWDCTEAVDYAGIYSWSAPAGGTIEQWTSQHQATYHCPPKETWPPIETLKGVFVQDVREMVVRVEMPLLYVGTLAYRETTVECRGVNPSPSQFAIDPCLSRDDSAPASRWKGLMRSKGVSSLRGFGGFFGRGVDYNGDGRGMDYGPVEGMRQGNETAPPRMRRCTS